MLSDKIPQVLSLLSECQQCRYLAVNDLCKTAYEQGVIRLLSDGTPQRDFIHGTDVCRSVELLLTRAEKSVDNVYHVSSGTTLTLLEIALIVKNVYQEKYQKDISIMSPGGALTERHLKENDRYSIDHSKLRQLGFSPQITLEQGITDMFNYLETL